MPRSKPDHRPPSAERPGWALHAILRALMLCAAFAIAFGCAGRASAQELGKRGNLVLAADRLFGLYIDNQSFETEAIDRDNDHAVIAIGWSKSASLLSVPRLGVDYLITDALSIGGSLGIASHNRDNGNGDEGTVLGVLFGLRAGYVLRLDKAFAFWPRGGLTYTTQSAEGIVNDGYVLALSVDAPFAIALSESFAFLIGPCIELGFVGRAARQDYSEIMFGLMFGLAGFIGL